MKTLLYGLAGSCGALLIGGVLALLGNWGICGPNSWTGAFALYFILAAPVIAVSAVIASLFVAGETIIAKIYSRVSGRDHT